MIVFQTLLNAGASVAAMSDASDGDCGWDGVPSGERGRFLDRADVPAERVVALRQCHGDTILEVSEDQAGRGALGKSGALADADGLITACANIPLGIMVADCVPVFLVAPGAVALVHAGREGTRLRIAEKAAELLNSLYGIDLGAVSAVVGPSAGPCCYEVSGEILDSCLAAGMVCTENHIDLWASNVAQLVRAGIPSGNIFVAKQCTICQPGFHSHRGQGTSKRNLAVIMR